jgi:hypothetical protein
LPPSALLFLLIDKLPPFFLDVMHACDAVKRTKPAQVSWSHKCLELIYPRISCIYSTSNLTLIFFLYILHLLSNSDQQATYFSFLKFIFVRKERKKDFRKKFFSKIALIINNPFILILPIKVKVKILDKVCFHFTYMWILLLAHYLNKEFLYMSDAVLFVYEKIIFYFEKLFLWKVNSYKIDCFYVW